MFISGLTVFGIIFTFANFIFAQVINEVLYDPDGVDTGKEWVEIYNPTDTPIDMDGWDLDPSDQSYYTFKSFILLAKSYVVVHINATGTDTQSDLYAGKGNMSNTSGVFALFDSTSHSSSTLVDYFEYGAGGQTNESKAVSAGIWTAGDSVPDVEEGHSIEYDGSGDSSSDYFDQSHPTPGGDNSLSVSLSSFTAASQGNGIILTWTTESEVNTLGFRVLRSVTARDDFVPVSDLIQGAGNSTVAHQYKFIDQDVQPDVTYYYRLKNIDFNGNSEIHGIVSASVSDQAQFSGTYPNHLQLSEGYPNPFGPGVDETDVSFNMLVPENSTAKMDVGIWNLLGQEVKHFGWMAPSPGNKTFFWDGRGENRQPMPAGIYFLRVDVGHEQLIRRVLFVR